MLTDYYRLYDQDRVVAVVGGGFADSLGGVVPDMQLDYHYVDRKPITIPQALLRIELTKPGDGIVVMRSPIKNRVFTVYEKTAVTQRYLREVVICRRLGLPGPTPEYIGTFNGEQDRAWISRAIYDGANADG